MPDRKRLPAERSGVNRTVVINNEHEVVITTGNYEDGTLGEIFLRINKEGSTLSGFLNSIAIGTSTSLQRGVPLKVFVKKFIFMKFEPYGMTNDPTIPEVSSIVDYIFRWLARKYLSPEDCSDIGI